jgi:tRNA (guanine-N7-)-methyltransferase
MSTRNKLEKFAEVLSFPNVFENFNPKDNILVGKDGIEIDYSSGWNDFYFKNNNPIVLELACGRGEYSLELARRNPDVNYIGVDIKGARIWKGAKIALEEKISNIAFLRTKIEHIEDFFKPGEIDHLWITFPDPFLKKSKSNRRLTSPYFLDRYRKILRGKGLIHLKTDSPELYEFTLETISQDSKCNVLYDNNDIYSKELDFSELEIKTYYEKQHLTKGRKIKYLKFTIN